MTHPDLDLAARVVARALPAWAGLPLRAVDPQGHDHRTYRLGDALAVRLPTAGGYVPQLVKEVRWLPHLAAHLAHPVPEVVAVVEPDEVFPLPWSVRRWLPGEVASRADGDPLTLAGDLADALVALRAVPAADGPPPGQHSAHRGASLRHYEAEARTAVGALPAADRERADRVLDAAVATRWEGPPVWFHGDVAADNVLVRDGRFTALLDWGCAGVGDPACDVVPAWTVFEGEARAVYRERLAVDDDTWARGRGWALWKAVITLADPDNGAAARTTLAAVLA
ncbi:aminoglycoside phosphotransferase family protein [Modestobacter sp. Leaf380]|uniref:aminoglycoside phosphotransferase family protein n=1 Tax=Modestobacter sp. Leaf380 TaxID=1736356 RepID=UPI0006FF2E81|nr:aminoglycoside phosphotransferase family protein [Modestobacter sp. Leaf380]KQS73591.1 hypothetical protein ASG41_02915 [Modestobacter sp. Leaf380]